MSSINGLNSNQPINKIQAPVVRAPETTKPAESTGRTITDKVELSGVSHLLTSLKTNDVRLDKVADIRAQIANGTYETDDKLDIAADRLLDDLA